MSSKKEKTSSKSQDSHHHTSSHRRTVNRRSQSPHHISKSLSRSRSAHRSSNRRSRSQSLSHRRSRSRLSRSRSPSRSPPLRSHSRSPKPKHVKSERESGLYPGLYSLPQPPIPGVGIPSYPGNPLNDPSNMAKMPLNRGFLPPVPGVLPPANILPTNITGTRGFDGFIFECNNQTFEECMKLKIFGGPKYMLPQVSSITPYNTPLFLYHNSNRTLYGVFESTSVGRENINPTAWNRSGGTTPFPSQVNFRYKYQFLPLPETEFQHMLHYSSSKKPRPELFKDQICQLIKLFAINNAKTAHRAATQLIQFFKLE